MTLENSVLNKIQSKGRITIVLKCGIVVFIWHQHDVLLHFNRKMYHIFLVIKGSNIHA